MLEQDDQYRGAGRHLVRDLDDVLGGDQPVHRLRDPAESGVRMGRLDLVDLEAAHAAVRVLLQEEQVDDANRPALDLFAQSRREGRIDLRPREPDHHEFHRAVLHADPPSAPRRRRRYPRISDLSGASRRALRRTDQTPERWRGDKDARAGRHGSSYVDEPPSEIVEDFLPDKGVNLPRSAVSPRLYG